MSSIVTIGNAVQGGAVVSIHLAILLRTRLLLGATSGAGKSRTLRRLLEQAYGITPFGIIDPEGEFPSLRERLDVLLIGKGGDTPADVRSAPLLARQILEAGVSFVVDLFELKGDARHAWVASFVDAWMEAPRELWRDYLFAIDEIEFFAPEKGHGESPAAAAVKDLATRGRKRGTSLIGAGLRLSALDKNIAAQMQNRAIGRTTLDVDLDRAAQMMGVRKGREGEDFKQGLRRLQPGQFWVSGPAFSVGQGAPGLDESVLLQVGSVATTHPEPGARPVAPPPPTSAIRKLLPKLADLPKEAERKEAGEQALRAEIQHLRGELDHARRLAPAPQRVEVPTVPEGLLGDVEVLIGTARAGLNAIENVIDDLTSARDRIRGIGIQEGARPLTLKERLRAERLTPEDEEAMRALVAGGGGHSSVADWKPTSAPTPRPRVPGGDGDLPKGARMMLEAVAARGSLTRSQMATLASMAPTGGTFQKYLSTLKTSGLIEVSGDAVTITGKGRSAAGDVRQPSGPGEVLALWRDKMPGKARDMLELFAAEHGPFTKDQLGKRLDLDPTGGTFQKYLSILRSNGLVRKGKGGLVVDQELAL